MERRNAGLAPDAELEQERLIDPFAGKLDKWMARSDGRLRADVAHDKLVALGYAGSERTTRRAVTEARRRYRAGHRRVFRPWIPDPGMWLQYHWGQGPRVGERRTSLWCAWLAWSRFRAEAVLRAALATSWQHATRERRPDRQVLGKGLAQTACVDRLSVGVVWAPERRQGESYRHLLTNKA